MFPSVLDSPVKKTNVIQATLIFDLPPPQMESIEEEIPQAVEPQEMVPAAELPKNNLIEPVNEVEKPLPPVALPQPTIEDKLPPETEDNSQVNDNEATDIKANDIITTDKDIEPANSSEMRSSRSSMVKRHLNSFQQLQQNKMAEQASRNYQKRKNSPVINGQVQDPFMTEDEKIRESFKVRADCSSASKQTTAVVLGFLGAQIDCSKPPPISGFIQDRINKKSHLPSLNQQAEQKIPQSVVIKK
ncbi:hypothetical protein [Paraglaciecola arctica]|uniref:hypothetical protein n=1 Tax=Paraglaciecola arctica TaxID=1128911 RepID=UPI001C06AD56|nr:hypothetical protein [Paraglaciecola arctica]MBU3002182.1 hypothetical protein [Paraglaciecola arctica]